MAAPVDAGRALTDGSTVVDPQTLNLPGSIAAGDMLLGVVRTPGTRTITWPDDWDVLYASASPDASDDSITVAAHECDGTEGATISIDLSSGSRMAGICWRITGAVGATISSPAIGSASQPDSPSYSLPAAQDVLWLSVGGCDDAETLTSGPSGYSNAVIQAASGATGASTCTVFGASLQATADTTEDPGAWTLGTTSIWTAFTVALLSESLPRRVSQLPVEAVIEPTSGTGRISQVPVEAVIEPTSAQARVSQLPVEVVIDLLGGRARLSQVPVEVVIENVSAVTRFQAILID